MKSYPKYGKPFEPGRFYHIYNRSVGEKELFVNRQNYKFFLDRFQFYTKRILAVYAYCLMPNHFHFLIKVNNQAEGQEISSQLRKLFISYSKAFNLQQNRSGTLFNRHLKRVEIESDEQLLWTIYYIHRNPLHHYITNDYRSYKWSSYPALSSEKPTKLDRKKVLELFNGKDNMVAFHDKNIEEDVLHRKIPIPE